MATDLIRYDLLVQDALKGVVRKVLTDAGKVGSLPGEHHFYVSFRTDAPGVRVSQRLRDKYPEEMTIVLQHQFWDLKVTDHAVEVGLSFSGVPERLLVPFDALVGFFDPSVQFGLKFETATPAEGAPEGDAKSLDAKPLPAPAALPAPKRGPRGAGSEPTVLRPVAPGEGSEPPKDGAQEKGGTEPKERGRRPALVEVEAADAEGKPEEGEKVISLDAFRKKP